MMGTCEKPASSNAERSAPTRPSIMSDGATMSAPARAWLTASAARSPSVSSLSTPPRSSSTPQWPWLVYSHKHTSVITWKSGACSLMARTACCTTPRSS